jgi:hypothetical protein
LRLRHRNLVGFEAGLLPERIQAAAPDQHNGKSHQRNSPSHPVLIGCAKRRHPWTVILLPGHFGLRVSFSRGVYSAAQLRIIKLENVRKLSREALVKKGGADLRNVVRLDRLKKTDRDFGRNADVSKRQTTAKPLVAQKFTDRLSRHTRLEKS